MQRMSFVLHLYSKIFKYLYMKKSLFISFCVCLLFAFLSCSKENEEDDQMSSAYYEFIKDILDCMNMPRPSGSYNYPIFPTTPEWMALVARQDMVDACKIPEKRLRSMSTQAVIQALWEFPLILDVSMFYDRNYQQGFEFVIASLDSYQELIKRDDAVDCLWERYLLINPNGNGVSFLCPRILELFFSQYIFLDNLTLQEHKRIVMRAFEIDDFMQQTDRKNYPYRLIAWYMIARIMWHVAYEPLMQAIANDASILLFLETGYWEDPQTYLSVIYCGLEFIK